ncbi:hypothetical protein ABH917_004396 [Thermobifida halotolerans]
MPTSTSTVVARASSAVNDTSGGASTATMTAVAAAGECGGAGQRHDAQRESARDRGAPEPRTEYGEHGETGQGRQQLSPDDTAGLRQRERGRSGDEGHARRERRDEQRHVQQYREERQDEQRGDAGGGGQEQDARPR